MGSVGKSAFKAYSLSWYFELEHWGNEKDCTDSIRNLGSTVGWQLGTRGGNNVASLADPHSHQTCNWMQLDIM